MRTTTSIVSFLSLLSVASATNYDFDCGSFGGGSITVDSNGMDFDVNLVGLVAGGVVSGAGVPLSYHLHTIWTNEGSSSTSQCGSPFTGLHYDPDFKCGPASQARDQPQCDDVTYGCSTSSPDQCERGDLSGKYGTLVVQEDGSATKSVTDDQFGATTGNFVLDNLQTSPAEWSSIVFHDTTNSGARVLCCKIQEGSNGGGGTGGAGGDPHFKTWPGVNGQVTKFDYHGECDLVLLDHPSFGDGLGLKVHIRTTRHKYFSYIETIAVQIGKDTLEFNNDLENYLINGNKVEDPKSNKNSIAGYELRRYQKRRALSLRLDSTKWRHNIKSQINFYYRDSGFPFVKLDGKDTDVFQGSLGLLGNYTTGKMVGRDGVTEISDATNYALEWQVRDTEPMLFSTARAPQFPAKCVPPKMKLGKRLGDSHMLKAAEEACAAWKEDKDECLFDVMATRSIALAAEPM